MDFDLCYLIQWTKFWVNDIEMPPCRVGYIFNANASNISAANQFRDKSFDVFFVVSALSCLKPEGHRHQIKFWRSN